MQERRLYSLEEKRLQIGSWRAYGQTLLQHCELHGIKFFTIQDMTLTLREIRIDGKG
ncbi:hypothetical protein I5M86_00035 [Serratia marcescens]|nr:hypothetical protein [Serratia marcescens]MBH3063771.1 hypothetical protein [Serratia marcescens]